MNISTLQAHRAVCELAFFLQAACVPHTGLPSFHPLTARFYPKGQLQKSYKLDIYNPFPISLKEQLVAARDPSHSTTSGILSLGGLSLEVL